MSLHQKLLKFLRNLFRSMMAGRLRQPCLFPAGHFYSPIPDLKEVKSNEGGLWAPKKEMAGIDWNETAQLSILRNIFSKYVADIDFPLERLNNDPNYYYNNDQFPVLDAEVLYCFLRHFRPARMVEIGSGFSSLVTAQVNREHLGNSLHFTCIEPYPVQFLRDGVDGISELMVKKVQEIPPEYFAQLESGDILFIDSSHVSKVGSDVNYIYFEILPRLKEGVLVHIHDIFLPDEYPKKWVLEEGRYWNEQYLVRAFLEFNSSFEIVWSAHYMGKHHGTAVTGAFTRYPRLGGGGSLWLRRLNRVRT